MSGADWCQKALRSPFVLRALAISLLLNGCGGADPPAAKEAHALTLEGPSEFWWYWDRPQSELPPPPTGVGAAVVAMHVYFVGSEVRRVYRRSALKLPDRVVSVPVVHVEVDPSKPFAATLEQRDALRGAVRDLVAQQAPLWVQLDFEARPSQRQFWREAVDGIRADLPPSVGLSVTALASWCHGDAWLQEVSADEIVPMYFRLGRAREQILSRVRAGETRSECRRAYGIATDELPWPLVMSGRRYVFVSGRPQPHAAPATPSR